MADQSERSYITRSLEIARQAFDLRACWIMHTEIIEQMFGEHGERIAPLQHTQPLAESLLAGRSL